MVTFSQHFLAMVIPFLTFKSQELLPPTATQGWLGLLASGQLNIIPSSLVFSRELADFPISQDIPKDLLLSSFLKLYKNSICNIACFHISPLFAPEMTVTP